MNDHYTPSLTVKKLSNTLANLAHINTLGGKMSSTFSTQYECNCMPYQVLFLPKNYIRAILMVIHDERNELIGKILTQRFFLTFKLNSLSFLGVSFDFSEHLALFPHNVVYKYACNRTSKN